MSWLQTVFASLLGTAVGAGMTAWIADVHERKRANSQTIEALASVQKELLVAANQVVSSIVSAQMALHVNNMPTVTDDITLMYRTHASVIHGKLSAKDVLTVTVAYSCIGTYGRGRDLRTVEYPFAYIMGLYIHTLNALYNAYMLLGGILQHRYSTSIDPEFAIYYLGATIAHSACGREVDRLDRLESENPDQNTPQKNGIFQVKASAEFLMKAMEKHGYSPPTVQGNATSSDG